jgi:hypothetical protein
MKILEENNFTEAERELVNLAGTGETASINRTRVVAEIVAAKKYEQAIEKLIKSNERVANSNEKHSKK